MKGKICIIAKFHGTDLVICNHSHQSYSQINMVAHRGLNHIDMGKKYRLYIHTDKGKNSGLKVPG